VRGAVPSAPAPRRLPRSLQPGVVELELVPAGEAVDVAMEVPAHRIAQHPAARGTRTRTSRAGVREHPRSYGARAEEDGPPGKVVPERSSPGEHPFRRSGKAVLRGEASRDAGLDYDLASSGAGARGFRCRSGSNGPTSPLAPGMAPGTSWTGYGHGASPPSDCASTPGFESWRPVRPSAPGMATTPPSSAGSGRHTGASFSSERSSYDRSGRRPASARSPSSLRRGTDPGRTPPSSLSCSAKRHDRVGGARLGVGWDSPSAPGERRA
jgi:hypothetical protein